MGKITVSYVREILDDLQKEKISFSRMVELLNEKASEREGQWAAGWAKCDLCGFEWVAARPAECTELECSNCGHLTTFTTPEDEY